MHTINNVLIRVLQRVLDDESFQQINCNQYCRDLLYSKSFYHNHIKLLLSSEPKIKYNINNKTYTNQIFKHDVYPT